MTTSSHAPRLAPILGALALAVVAVVAGAPSTAAAATGPAAPPPPPPPAVPAHVKIRPVALVPTRLRLRADRDETGVTLRLR